ncbi:hypothetical protein WJX73_010848 [Symbiochloris irregularis]|uniref:VWFA domain-containing protein n=1 Tax=Symbiochloris irregularis TaxID=706552 RepID=A0AAW1PS39_9CHLO
MPIRQAVAKTVPLFEEVALSLAVELQAARVDDTPPARLIVCLDHSGSMAGKPLQEAQFAITELYKRVLAERALASNVLLTFDTYATRYELDPLDAVSCASTIYSIQARGGTSFQSVLVALQEEIRTAPEGSSFFVAFFTDGQDTSGMNGRYWGCQCAACAPGYAAPVPAYAPAAGAYMPVGYTFGAAVPAYPAAQQPYMYAALAPSGSESSGSRSPSRSPPRSAGGASLHLEHQGIVQSLKGAIDARKAMCQIHTIGFSADHDARFLSELTRAGSEEGTFHYIKGAQDIQETMSTVKDLVLTCSFLPSLQLYMDTGRTLNIPLRAISQEAGESEKGVLVLKGTGFVEALPEGMQVLNGKAGDEDVRIKVSIETAEEDQQLLDTVEYVHMRVRALTASITNGSLSRQELQQIEAGEYAKLRELVGSMDKAACAHRGAAQRRVLRGPVMELATLLNSLFTNALGPALTSTLTNDKIASLNALAYKHVTTSRLNVKLERTAAENVAKLEESEAKLREQVKKLNLDSLEQNEAEVEAQGQCNVTLQNYVEALRDVDCMCLGLDVSRPEAAIADPSRVIIKSILPTFITAEAFLEAVTFALDKNTYNEEGVHGGFGPAGQSAKVMPGSANENLTGVLPLFINSAHWTVAREKLKPILGWTCTLNILGFTHQQVKVVPFLVLIKAIADYKQQPVDFRRRALRLVMDVCMALYKEGKAIREEIFDESGALKFLSGPQHRTLDMVPNMGVLLVYYLCAALAGELSKITPEQWQELTGAIIEEELRRAQRNSIDGCGTKSDIELWDVLAMSEHGDIRPIVQPVLEANGEMPIPSRDTLWPQLLDRAAGMDWSKRIDNFATHKVLRGMSKDLNRLAPHLYILQLASTHACNPSLAFLDKLPDPPSPEEAPRNDPAPLPGSDASAAAALSGLEPSVVGLLPKYNLKQYAAMWMQNRRTVKNSDRREWIEGGHYGNPVATAAGILDQWWAAMVLSVVQEEFSNMKVRLMVYRAEKRERTFKAAGNLQEAATAAAGAYIGKLDLRGLIVGLHQTPADDGIAKQKMELLMAGEHDGTRIFKDKGPTTAWQPSRRNCCRFVRNNFKVVPCEEAIKMFPHLKPETITEWYRRLLEDGGDGMGDGRQKQNTKRDHSVSPMEVERKRARRK